MYLFSTAPLSTLGTAKAYWPSEGFIYGGLAQNLSEQVFRCLFDFALALSGEEESGENLRTDWYSLVSGEVIIKWFVRGLL